MSFPFLTILASGRSAMTRAFIVGVLAALAIASVSCAFHSPTAGHSHAGAPVPSTQHLAITAEIVAGHTHPASGSPCTPNGHALRAKPTGAPSAHPVTAPTTSTNALAATDLPKPQDALGSPATARTTRTGRLTLLRVGRWRI